MRRKFPSPGPPAETWRQHSSDGEDFELLFTIDPRQVTALRKKWARKFALELTEIGRVVRSRQKITLITSDGSRKILTAAGYDHFPTS